MLKSFRPETVYHGTPAFFAGETMSRILPEALPPDSDALLLRVVCRLLRLEWNIQLQERRLGDLIIVRRGLFDI